MAKTSAGTARAKKRAAVKAEKSSWDEVVESVDEDGDLVIDADPVKKIGVKLVGVRYEIVPPKASLALKLAVKAKQSMSNNEGEKVLVVLDEWMSKAFGSAFKSVKKRLDDPQDDLDITHVMALMEKVTEKSAGGDPTS